jgi:hypothetical protein
MLGCSTPEWLAKGMHEDSFAGGFMARIIFVNQMKGRRKVAFPILTPEQKALQHSLIMDLQHIARQEGEVKIGNEAKEFYTEWYENYEPDFSTRIAGYYQRKPVHVLKVATIISIAENDNKVIEVKHLRSAFLMLEHVEQTMSDAFVFVGATNEAKIGQQILATIQEKGGAITHKQLVNRVKHSIKNMREFRDIMQTLSEAGILMATVKDGAIIYVFTQAFIEFEAKKRELERKKTNPQIVKSGQKAG